MIGKKLIPFIFFACFACSAATETDYISKISGRIDKKDIKGAQSLISEALSKYPDSADLYYYRGWSYLQSSPEKAISDFNISLQKNKNNSNGYKGLGVVHTILKKYPEAEEFFSKAAQYSENDKQKSSVLADMAILAFEQKNYQKASNLSLQAIQLNDIGDYYSTLGSSYYMMQKKIDSQIIWERAVSEKKFADESVKVLISYKLTALLVEQKKFSEARKHLTFCINSDPRNTDFIKLSELIIEKENLK